MIKFTRLLSIGLISVTIAGLMTACSNSKNSDSSSKDTTPPSVALVTDSTTINDRSFNQSAWNGVVAYGEKHNLKRGKDGYEVFTNTHSNSDNLQQAINSNYKTIFSLGLNSESIAAAKKYPKRNFVLFNHARVNLKNVASINFKSEQAAYLAGVVAARTTKTNKIGFIGGKQDANTQKFERGFAQGVKDTGRKIHKRIALTSQYSGSFSDTNKVQNLAEKMYSNNADIIFQAAGDSGQGAFTAAKQINSANVVTKKVWVIGIDSDQADLGKYDAKGGQESNETLTSVLTNLNLAVENVADQAFHGKFPGKTVIQYTLENNGVGITHNPTIPISVWTAVQKTRQQIIDHKITIN